MCWIGIKRLLLKSLETIYFCTNFNLDIQRHYQITFSERDSNNMGYPTFNRGYEVDGIRRRMCSYINVSLFGYRGIEVSGYD